MYKIADQYGTMLPFYTRSLQYACHFAEAWRSLGFECFVVNTRTASTVDEDYCFQKHMQQCAEREASALFASDFESKCA